MSDSKSEKRSHSKKSAVSSLPTKMLGDAGEYYALSQFLFAGVPGTKMPDNWTGYDLAVDVEGTLTKVSVKVRSEGDGWRFAKFFTIDEQHKCDWYVFIFKQKSGELRSWVIPAIVVLEHASKPGPTCRNLWMRDISWAKLTGEKLKHFEDNGSITPDGTLAE